MKRPLATMSAAKSTVADHRRRKRSLERAGSTQSRRGLDWMNFFIADVQEGFGAFIAFYLANLSWTQEQVGLMLTIGRITSAVVLIPGGALTDAAPWKRALVAAGIVMIAVAALIFALHPTHLFVLIAEVLHGATAGILTPAIAAISMGLVGRRAFSCRVGRNIRFDAAGNALVAVIMGALGSYVAKSAIFLAAAGLSVPALLALSFVRKDEIDYHRARNAGKDREGRPTLQGLTALLKNRQLLWYAVSTALFQIADASMLTLAVEKLGRGNSAHSSLMTAALIVAPQIVVALLAPWTGYFSELWGRKPILLISFAAQIVRAALFAFFANSTLLIIVQTLDGVSGAVRTVLTPVIVADVTTGTGRFNVALGAVGLVTAGAASISTTMFGYVAQSLGQGAAFLGMAALAAAGGLVVMFLLNETKPAEYLD